jgi:hypothetical protein
MDGSQLADFTRREALQPEDVGLPREQRRRTGGLHLSLDERDHLAHKAAPRASAA